MTLRRRLVLMSAIFALGFVIFGLLSFFTLSQVRVNGPIYGEIVQQKDLLADILPPPEYLVESHLVTLQMRDADPVALKGLIDSASSLQKLYEERHEYWKKELPAGEAKRLLVDTAYVPGREYLELQRQYIAALQQGGSKAAGPLIESMAEKYRQHRAAIDELVKVATANAARQEQEAAATIQLETILLLVLGVAFLGVGVFVATRIIRSVMRQLGGDPTYAAEVAERMAAGQLTDIQLAEGDRESVLAAMKALVETFRGFVAAQAEMARQHEAGMIDQVIAADRFAGVYGQMARSINELVQSHIAVKMRVVDVVKRYAIGDLSVDMDRLPGQKAQITAAIDGVRDSLRAVNQQIEGLVTAAANGDFKARGDEAQFQFEFRAMVAGLNRLMEVSDTGLSEVSRILNALAKGDLTQTIEADYQGVFGQLKDDANTTVERLREVVGRIKEATEAINTAAQEIAAGNQDLSSRTEEQASSLEETASSMEELNATVRQNAENARQANELAKSSNEGVVKGGEVVKRVVVTMGEIQESSKKIADIIGVIDSIAFQTNILALNAAVEAARAGEQGRGFAVVATEVRNLAQRSATAAKEIKGLIAESVGKVESGAKLVGEAGSTMDEVVRSFQRVANLVTEITNASREQSSGIEQVTQAVSQMDEVTQQNAALVEEAAAAAESLEEQARGLVQAVGMFKLATRASTQARLLEQASIGGMDFAAAIDAHQQWRRRLLSYVVDSSSEQLDPEVVSCDDRCALGQWIYGSCRPAMGNDSRCENLRVSHAHFHQCAGQIIREKLAGHKIEALNLIKGDFTRHSEETVRHIKEIRRVWAEDGVSPPLPPSMPAGAAKPVRQAVLPAHLVDDQDEWEEF